MLTRSRIQSRGFSKPPKPPRLRDMERPPQKLARSVNFAGGTSGIAIEKENAVYSEPYRRLVAALPCAACKVEGHSQAAHQPPTGKGRKEDDRACFPLCCTRPGVVGCHVEFDQYRLVPGPAMREQARTWGRQTRAEIRNSGNWPASVEWSEA